MKWSGIGVLRGLCFDSTATDEVVNENRKSYTKKILVKVYKLVSMEEEKKKLF